MILDKIIASTKIRVAKAKENLSPSGLLKALDKAELKAPNFKNGLMSIDDVSIIAEIKKASPSKGLIRGDFDHMKIAEEYDKCNVRCGRNFAYNGGAYRRGIQEVSRFGRQYRT